MIKKGINKRLAEMGKIKIGGKGETRTSKSGTQYQVPVRYDHFVVTKTEKGPDGNYLIDDRIMKLLGPEPKEIKIRLLFDDIDLNFYTSFAYYAGSKCLCRGDGEIAEMTFQQSGKPTHFTIMDQIVSGSPDHKIKTRYEKSKKQEVTAGDIRFIICDPDSCPMMKPDSKGATRCKPSGILSCILSDIPEIGGVLRFRTHSWNTISNILSSLEFLKTITNGILVGLPMKLQFLKKSTQDHGNVSVVNIVFDGETYQAMRELAMIEMKNRTEHGINMKMIEERARLDGFTKDTYDPADIEAEFYSVPPETEPLPDNIEDRADIILGGVSEPEKLVEEEIQEHEYEMKTEKQESEPESEENTELDIF
jgi:hypothetical protein